ncbi:hypothetical protein Paes_0238 [Prosthecochloris aestuarii DSM 271]|uniref:Uncharacterized protein n=1 Tax=Prosthecochloris aestuarii (strain DSM 271 / SK 413) TaxID=290512 RepID=B4S3U9_PROA2|nr:hypothetical protein [Prosthecochloris aestuarii]ACF45295.1 hypothetical protein Paes_0238 [Prosthecochloris aestuarii DSM 271]
MLHERMPDLGSALHPHDRGRTGERHLDIRMAPADTACPEKRTTADDSSPKPARDIRAGYAASFHRATIHIAGNFAFFLIITLL